MAKTPPPPPLPGPPSPRPVEVVWREEVVLVTREGTYWSILRGKRRVAGPIFMPGELWSSTQDRIREWLDLLDEPERLA